MNIDTAQFIGQIIIWPNQQRADAMVIEIASEKKILNILGHIIETEEDLNQLWEELISTLTKS